jgi:hypothetical protein
LLLPDAPEWRAALTGALLLLADAANWEQFGDLTADETANKWQEVLDTFLEGEICP